MTETEILQYAIKGYEQQQEAIEERTRELRAELGPPPVTFATPSGTALTAKLGRFVRADEDATVQLTSKRQFSALTRKRMARAQRLRWQKRSA